MKLIIINPEHLNSKKEYSKEYSKLKKTYHNNKLSNYIDGKKVKYWKIVRMADDSWNDEFVPIFSKG